MSRYLYQGVIAEHDIIEHRDGQVTFRYVDSATKKMHTRTLPGPDFLWLIIQHVLPRGLQRVRHYGLLHHRQDLLRKRVQILRYVQLPPKKPRGKRWRCRKCGDPMRFDRITAGSPPFQSRAPPADFIDQTQQLLASQA